MVHLKFATAVFFEIRKGLVIIYVEKGWGGGGERRENIFGRSKSLPSRPCEWQVSLLSY